MLYHLFYSLVDYHTFFNVFRYITFRTIYAVVTALLICWVVGPWAIRQLRRHSMGQSIRPDGPSTHLSKEGTPTMGGLVILLASVVATLLWADLTNIYVWLVLWTTLGFGAVGFLDDLRVVRRRSHKGMSGRLRLVLEFTIAGVTALILAHYPAFSTTLTFPFFKEIQPDLGPLYIPFALFVIVGAANAVNLTDGLDGLAIGPVTIAAGTYLLFSYLTGNFKTAQYLQIPYVAGVGELSVLCGALVGAGMGFLWFNAYPAEVFMGDVGSLSLGAALGTVAVVTKHEILLAIVGGIFVVEALSVILQVSSFRLRGKRVFRMAPIHHHFEMKGWPEPKIIVRFWILSIFLGLLAISTLKLR
ncbi:MAG: phospho-N-acetylmuramoyl-pentapeptide-transferase [Thermodesulfobacteriota bacterium]